MIVGLDSSASVPSAAQAVAARAAGIRLWSGYLATRPGVKLYHPWNKADFDNARLCGGTPIAFASGWDDPAACKALAAGWGVRLCLDVEGGIRGDGSWVQPWLDVSGAGLYGVLATHGNRRAPFHVLAWYRNDPSATWANYGRPATPCGWQWQNTHTEFGASVDRGYYDDWFGGGSVTATAGSEVQVGGLHMDADVQAAFDKLYTELRGNGPNSKLDTIYTELRGTGPHSKLDDLIAKAAGSGDPAVAADLAAIHAILDKHFK